MDVADGEHGGVARLVQELALQLQLRVARLAAVVEPAPPTHPRGVLVVAVDHPARAVVVHRGPARPLPPVDEHVDVRLRVVADRRALRVRRRVAQVLFQELGIVEQLLQVITDLGEPRRNALRLDGGARVGEELIERVGSGGGHGGLLSPGEIIAGRALPGAARARPPAGRSRPRSDARPRATRTITRSRGARLARRGRL